MTIRLRELARGATPPFLWDVARRLKSSVGGLRPAVPADSGGGSHQDLDVYWDPQMAAMLETWGEGNAWHEIRMLMTRRSGKVLDIACGTGKVMSIVRENGDVELHGCDISDFLLSKAMERGIEPRYLQVCDATAMPYPDDSFDFAYSIGSLEHFTADGIDQVFQGCRRIVRQTSFHMIPVSRSGKDEGWIKPYQAYFNNSVSWWVAKAQAVFSRVDVIDSIWQDNRSKGIWLTCSR